MYRRRRFGGKKYSYETTNVNVDVLANASQVNYLVVPPVSSYGKRKAKNFTLQLGVPSTLEKPLVGALVYVPEGTSPSTLTTTGNNPAEEDKVSSLYEPSQNVLCSFVIQPGQTQPLLKRVSLARNLDSSDTIVLVVKPYQAMSNSAKLSGTISYAIKY